MRVLFLTRSFYPHVGGVETHIREVGKRLVTLGHEVIIITEERSSNSEDQGAKKAGNLDSLKIYRIPIAVSEKQKKYTIWRWLWQHKSLLEEADVIHCHDVFYWYLPFRFRYPFKKVYTTFHGYETVFPPRKEAIRMRKISEKLSHGNICVGDFIKKWYGTVPTYTTYGGVSTNEDYSSSDRPMDENREVLRQAQDTFSSRLRSNNKLPSKFHVLFIGRIEEDTGVAEYVKFLELLQRNKINFSFIAIGEGSLKSSFKSFGETVGFVGNPSQYIERSDIVFASSYLSMLEALVHKKLVIAFYANPLKRDYLLMSPFADYIIAEMNPEEAFKKLKYFTLNPNRLKKMITDGSHWAEEQTWDQVTELYLKLWNRKR